MLAASIDVWADVVALAIAALFIVAAASKASNRQRFATTLVAYGLPDGKATGALALAVPALETVSAVLVVFDPRASAAAMTTLLVIFTAGGVLALRSGARPSCGCFSLSSSPRSGVWTFGRNIVLLSAGGGTLVVGDATLGWSLPMVLGAGALVACVLIVEDLVALLEPTMVGVPPEGFS